jgi:proteasome assembly chaperone (PAC2) family protein
LEDIRFDRRPELNRPVFVVAYRGWNDAGSAASHAVERLIRHFGAEQFASIDPDEYFDFTQARPYTRPLDEYRRELTWPRNEFYQARGERDLVFLLGSEPHLRWRRYAQNVVALAVELGVSESLALGALLADTPHTRPVPVSGGASTAEVAQRLKVAGINGSRYEGPTGILSVVGSLLADAGIPNGSIWAATPHYISAAPNPRAAATLLRHLGQVLGLSVPADELESESAAYEAQIESALADNPEAQQYIRDLELRSVDADDAPLDAPARGEALEPLEPLDPSQAEGLFRSVEEFLRRGPQPGTGEEPYGGGQKG